MKLSHHCEAIIVTCIDYRFQQYIDDWLDNRFDSGEFDRVSLAGGVFDFYTVMQQVDISNKLHSINTVILMNHEDCGAYGDTGTQERHRNDLLNAKHKIGALYPNLMIETYYVQLDGDFVKV